MNLYKFIAVLALACGLAACMTEPGGITGGTVTTPNNTATLTLPPGTFSTPVPITIKPITIPTPNPLEYTALAGGGFELNAPNAFTANQNAVLEVQNSALSVAGKPFSLQALPEGSLVVALAQRPSDNQPTMLPAEPVLQNANGVLSWRFQIWKEYICGGCRILAAYLKPTRIEINAPDNVAEGSSVGATVSFFNASGSSVISYLLTTWNSSNPSTASVSSAGLISGIKLGQATIKAQSGPSSNPLNASKIMNVIASQPVLFAANFETGTIRGYSRGQVGSSGSPVPLASIILPTGTKPNDLAFDAAGNLWVTDRQNSRLLRFAPSQIASSGSPTPSVVIDAAYVNSIAANSLEFPVALTFAPNGDLWVTNEANRVVRFPASSLNASGTPQPDRVLTQGLNFPGGVAVDGAGNLWVSNYFGNSVARFTPTDTAPSYVLNQGLNAPVGLEFDSGGDLYVGLGGASSGIAVFTANQLGSTPIPAPARVLGGGGATNKIFGLAIDASNGTLWANNQGAGAAIAYTAAQLTTATSVPSISIGGATEANNGYGGVAFAGGGTAPAPRPVINSFSATPYALGVGGGSVTLNWNVTGATSLSIDQGVGAVTGSSTTRTVTSTTVFTLTATNANGNTSSSITVTVNTPPAANNPTTGTTNFAVTGLGAPQASRTSKYRVSGQAAPANGRPLVIYLHGNGTTDVQIPATYATYTDANAAVLVAPQGLNADWRFRMDGKNNLPTPPVAEVDDVAFIDEIITRATDAANPLFGAGNKVDPTKVFVVGESRGAGMAYYLYADPRTKNKIAAIAPISGTFFCETSDSGNGNPAYVPPANSDFNCGEKSAFHYFGPKASLYTRATTPRLLNIHGTLASGEFVSTPPPALDNEFGSLILVTKQWAQISNNCGASLPSASPVFTAPINGKTVNAYRQRNQANNGACSADVTFFIVENGGHVPSGFAERIIKWFFGQYNTQTNTFN
jgi:poly(3-hydroxybutyrate) depolymerase/streptogramin lyase